MQGRGCAGRGNSSLQITQIQLPSFPGKAADGREGPTGELLCGAIQNDVADGLIRGGVGQAGFPRVLEQQGARVLCCSRQGLSISGKGTKDGLQPRRDGRRRTAKHGDITALSR